MKIAVVSDTHDRTARVAHVVELIRAADIHTVIHCGDIESAAVVGQFAGLDAHFVFGNCDYDPDALREAMTAIGATCHDHWGHLELYGKKLAWTHGHDYTVLQELEYSEAYDFVFHGHTHTAVDRIARAGDGRVINPGAMQRVAVPTFVILDLATGVARRIEVEG